MGGGGGVVNLQANAYFGLNPRFMLTKFSSSYSSSQHHLSLNFMKILNDNLLRFVSMVKATNTKCISDYFN